MRRLFMAVSAISAMLFSVPALALTFTFSFTDSCSLCGPNEIPGTVAGLAEGLSDNTPGQPATVVIETIPSASGLTPPIVLPGVSDIVTSNVWDVTGGVVSSADFEVTDISDAFKLSLIYGPGGDHLGLLQDVAGDTILRGRLTLEQTPIPAALPLFATGLGALGLLGGRRKRKQQAAIAAQ